MSSERFSPQTPSESDPMFDGDVSVEASSQSPVQSLPVTSSSNANRSIGWRRRDKPLWPAIVLAMLVISGFVGLRVYKSITSASNDDATTTVLDSARLPVRTVTAETGLAQGWVFDEGAVWPVNRRVLNFQANGDITFVAKINGVELREGDFVGQGQLLATIDSRRQQSSIVTAQADIQVSETQRLQAQASLQQSQANLQRAESDLALARTELRRNESLFTEGAVSASTRDSYENQVQQAEAALLTAQQDVFSAEQGIQSADASIGSSKARLQQTAVDLEDTQLVSPIDGVVAYINIREGEYWSSQYLNTSSPQNLIETAPIVVVDPQSFEVELELQAEQADEIRPGQQAYVVLEEEVSAAQAAGAGNQTLLDIARQRGSSGQVFAVSPSQTPGSRGTEITIRDLEQVRNLKVGGRVYVWIEVASNPGAVVLPLGSLINRDQQFYVFVVNEADGTVQRRRVTPGIEGLAGVEILAGVEPGDQVVVEGQNRLVDGTPVEVIQRESGL